MKAMILAAGMGTRLGALTANTPKALVEINGVPLLAIVLQRLHSFGFNDITINVHHFADQIIDYLTNNNFGVKITISDERDQLLDTGGGIKKAAWFFNDGNPFLVHNVDIISNIDLKALYQYNINTKAMATLACKQRNSSRYFLFDEQQRLCGWENVKTGERKIATHTLPENPQRMAFSGIHVIHPSIFDKITSTGKFSIVDTYLHLAGDNLINCFDIGDTMITDVGTPEQLLSTNYTNYTDTVQE